jgi:hypothetical protein
MRYWNWRVTSLSNIAIRAEAYRAQNGLTQCCKCQKFGHNWANCKQPPPCTRMRCGDRRLHKECPEKSNTASIPTCCNWELVNGEEPHPSNYRGCTHAKEERRKRRSQTAPVTTTGRAFSSSHNNPGLSSVAVLRSNTRQEKQLHRPAPPQWDIPTTRTKSVQAYNANSSSLNAMFKVVATIYRQITTELNGARSEDVAITKIVLKLMNQNGR